MRNTTNPNINTIEGKKFNRNNSKYDIKWLRNAGNVWVKSES